MKVLATVVSICLALLLSYALVVSDSVDAQTADVWPYKFDEFGDLRTSDLKAHFDLYAEEVLKIPNSRAFIVCYRREGWLLGTFQRVVYGYQDYLVNSRGMPPERVSIIEGGIGEREFTELWIVPDGAAPPNVRQQTSSETNAPLQFDRLTLGNGCVGEYTLELQEPEDSVRFFAKALHKHPTMQGFIVVHPSTRGSHSEASRLAATSQNSLKRQHGIAPNRIITTIVSPRFCQEMNLWLVPSGFVVPRGVDPEPLFKARLMEEAEREQFTTRRVEFAGNAWTRDRVLRGRIPGLQEGEIFTRAILKRNLASLSRLKVIKRVDLSDVDVQLRQRDKMIDLTIYVKERRRANQ